MRFGIWCLGVVAWLCVLAGTVQAQEVRGTPLVLEKVVILMRHGARPPTHYPAMAEGYADGSWPRWTVPAGYLTDRGAADVSALGRYDRALYAGQGLFKPAGCPGPGAVAIWADTDERTEKTGDAWLTGFAPGCRLTAAHLLAGRDPLFSPAIPASLAAAQTIALQRDTDVAAAVAAHRPLLDQMQSIMHCCSVTICHDTGLPDRCTLADLPSRIEAGKGGAPRLTGALAVAGSMSEDLLCEYADGKAAADVGWGRADGEAVAKLLALHALNYSLLTRPHIVADFLAAPLAHRMITFLQSNDTGKLLVLVGHDTNIAALGGMLDVHWSPPGMATDDPPFAAQLGLALWRDPVSGRRLVQAFFQSQTIDQLRAAGELDRKHKPWRATLAMKGCDDERGGGCSLDRFASLITRRGDGDDTIH